MYWILERIAEVLVDGVLGPIWTVVLVVYVWPRVQPSLSRWGLPVPGPASHLHTQVA